MERLEAQLSATSEAYALAIRSVAQYAIELNAGEAAEFRKRLEALAENWDSARGDGCAPNRVPAIQASFRGELREYHEQATSRVDRLRRELESAQAAMAALAGNIHSSSADYSKEMKHELAHLEKIASWNDVAEIRRGIKGVVSSLSEKLDQMQRATEMAILQFQDEIRLLHQDLDAKRRALITDPSTGAWNRQKSEERLLELLNERESFLVLLVSVKNFNRLQSRFPRRVLEGALKALVKRLRAITGDDASIGRRNDGEFVAILDVDPTAAITISREAAVALSTTYAVQDAGASTPLAFEVGTGIVERPSGMPPAAFIRKLDQLSSALCGC
jgi:GGDEF domain-containing protein